MGAVVNMHMKWFGALFVVVGCSGVGWLMASAISAQIKMLEQIQRILSEITCELQFRQSMLPQLFFDISERECGPVATVFRVLSEQLSKNEHPQVYMCMKSAVELTNDLPEPAKEILLELGRSLGAYDLSGQLQQISAVESHTEFLLMQLRGHKDVRTRCCQTLGICTGVVIAILIV